MTNILSSKDLRELRQRGISVYPSGILNKGSITVELNTIGMAWLHNYHYYFSKIGMNLSQKRLKDMLRFSPQDMDCRELRIVATLLKTNDNEGDYCNYFFYLDGDPPRAPMNCDCCRGGICRVFSVPRRIQKPFKISNIYVLMCFTDEQVLKLKNGETLTEKARYV